MPRTGKKKKLEKRKRERGSTGTFARSELSVHGAGQEKGLELEEEEGWEGREGFWEQRCSRDSPRASCPQVGHPTWPCPLRVILCPWRPHNSCSLPWSVLGAGIGVWEQQGHPSWSIFADVPISPALLSPKAVTAFQGLVWTLETIPVPFPWLLGAGWTWQDLELLPAGRGVAPARHLRGNLSLD